MHGGVKRGRSSISLKSLLAKSLCAILAIGVCVIALSWVAQVLLREPERPQSFRIPADRIPDRVILYVIDAMRPDHLGLYGYDRDTAPTISVLASEGAMFTRTFAKSTWSLVSVESILSGMHGSAYMADRGARPMDDFVETFVAHFQAAGWRTGVVTENPFVNPRYNFTKDFDLIGDSGISGDKDKINWSWETQGNFVEFLEQVKDDRFFLYVHTMEPHSPIVLPDAVPPKYADTTADTFDLEGWYDSAIHFADQNLYRFIALLKERNLYDNTLLIITADHGESLPEGKSQGVHTGPPMLERIHVPLVIHWPGVIPAGTVYDDLIQQVDLAPTLLESARIPIPAHFQGQSLMGLLIEDDHSAVENRTLFAVGQALQDRAAAAGDHYLLISEGKEYLYDISPGESWGTECTEGNESTVSTLRRAMENHFSVEQSRFKKYKLRRKLDILAYIQRARRPIPQVIRGDAIPPPQSEEEHQETLRTLGYL